MQLYCVGQGALMELTPVMIGSVRKHCMASPSFANHSALLATADQADRCRAKGRAEMRSAEFLPDASQFQSGGHGSPAHRFDVKFVLPSAHRPANGPEPRGRVRAQP